MNFITVRSVALSALLAGVPALAQNYPNYAPQQQPYQNQGYQNQSYQNQSQAFAPAQLDDLVAPIALYPDSLLSQVLVASTYPQDLMEASQWLSQNGGLQGQSRIDSAQQQNWDASVQALVAFPDVLANLTQDQRWTADLGNAFLNQEADVMSAVQRMRQRAQQSGRLNSTPQQLVSTDTQYGEPIIEIEPRDPEVVYVPTYNPTYIWGAPSYGYYPSLYYPSFGFGFGRGISIGAFFGGFGGGRNNWGWGPRWHDRTVIVNRGFFDHNRFQGFREGGRDARFVGGSSVWSHDYSRRGGSTSFANRPTYDRSRSSQQWNSQPQNTQRGFAGSSFNNQRSFGGNNGGSNYGRGSVTPQARPQQQFTPQVSQPRTQQQPLGFGSFNGGNSSERSERATPTQQSYQGSRSFRGRSERTFAPAPQAPAPQPAQQSFQGSRSFGVSNGVGSSGRSERATPTQQSYQGSRSFGGSNGSGYSGRSERTQAPTTQVPAQQQQRFQQREASSFNRGSSDAPRSNGGGRGDGGPRR